MPKLFRATPYILTSRLHSFWACQFPKVVQWRCVVIPNGLYKLWQAKQDSEASGGNLHETTICFHLERPEAVDYSLASTPDEYCTAKRIFSRDCHAPQHRDKAVVGRRHGGRSWSRAGGNGLSVLVSFLLYQISCRGPHLPISISSHPLPDIWLMPAPSPVMSICARLQSSWLPG